MSVLVVFSGLPGTGKSTLAQKLGRATGALWVRIDDIETALANCDMETDDLADAGYAAAQAIAASALTQGFDVIADCVNPIVLTREAWCQIGQGHDVLKVQIICSDIPVHRDRVEARHKAQPECPDWVKVENRGYEIWTDADLTVDTAATDPQTCVAQIAQDYRDLQNNNRRGSR